MSQRSLRHQACPKTCTFLNGRRTFSVISHGCSRVVCQVKLSGNLVFQQVRAGYTASKRKAQVEQLLWSKISLNREEHIIFRLQHKPGISRRAQSESIRRTPPEDCTCNLATNPLSNTVAEPLVSFTTFSARAVTVDVKTREAFRDLRVEPSGKVTAANSYLKHNPTHYNQTNRRALTKLCLGQAAQNKLSSCGCKAVLQAPDFTSFFSRVT